MEGDISRGDSRRERASFETPDQNMVFEWAHVPDVPARTFPWGRVARMSPVVMKATPAPVASAMARSMSGRSSSLENGCFASPMGTSTMRDTFASHFTEDSQRIITIETLHGILYDYCNCS